MENQPDDFRALGIDGHFSIPHIISQQRAAKHHALFHAPGLSPFDAGTGGTALLLCHCGFNCQEQFRFLFQGVDLVV